MAAAAKLPISYSMFPRSRSAVSASLVLATPRAAGIFAFKAGSTAASDGADAWVASVAGVRAVVSAAVVDDGCEEEEEDDDVGTSFSTTFTVPDPERTGNALGPLLRFRRISASFFPMSSCHLVMSLRYELTSSAF